MTPTPTVGTPRRLRARGGGEQPVLGGGVGGLGAEEGPAVEAAGHGDECGERHGPAAPRSAEHAVDGVREGRAGLDEPVVGDRAEDGEGAQQVDDRRPRGADDGGASDGAPGVAHLAGADGGGLHAEVGEEEDGCRGGDGAHRALPARPERSEVAGVEEEESADGDEQQRDELEHRGHDLHGAHVAGARVVGEGGQPLDDEGREAGGPAVFADGDQHVEVADGRHGEGRVGDPGGDPVRPGGEEPGEVAEGLTGVHVRPAGAGVAFGEAAEDEGQGDGADRQHAEGEEADGAVGGDGRREQEDAAADDVAHDQRGGDGQSEAAGAPSRAVRSALGGVLRGRSRWGDGPGDVHGVVRLSSNGCPGSPGRRHGRG